MRMEIKERDELLIGTMKRTRVFFDGELNDSDRGKVADLNGTRIMILASVSLQGLSDALVEKILELRLWKVFGYSRLGDYLDMELRVPYDRMMHWVNEALRRGIEDKMIYIGPIVIALMERDADALATIG